MAGNDSILDLQNPPGWSYLYKYGTVRNNTNVQLNSATSQLIGLATLGVASGLGIPQVAQVGQSLLDNSNNYSIYKQYNAVPFDQLNNTPGIKYQDFRTKKISNTLTSRRLDGASAATRGSWIGAIYAAESVLPIGAYSTFNREANVNFGYGWGDHDNPYALRADFTSRSHVATKWSSLLPPKGKWIATINPLEIVTPFRGDKVQVIDFGQRKLKNVYKWKPDIFGLALGGALGRTQDFIKFYFTGPKLGPGKEEEVDDVIVFRAIIDNLTDNFSPSWTPVQLIGRGDPNYHYGGVTRNLDISFTIHATDRDEMKPIWRKLNALAGYTAPTYSDNIALEAPWMRITIGDLFYQQPAVLSTLTYTLHDTDTTWEINIEQDPQMMQAPKKISVLMGLHIITNELPQKNGRFYSFAKDFNPDKGGQSNAGDNNWLSDFERNPSDTIIEIPSTE